MDSEICWPAQKKAATLPPGSRGSLLQVVSPSGRLDQPEVDGTLAVRLQAAANPKAGLYCAARRDATMRHCVSLRSDFRKLAVLRAISVKRNEHIRPECEK